MLGHCPCTDRRATCGSLISPSKTQDIWLDGKCCYGPRNFARYRIIFQFLKFLRKTNALKKSNNLEYFLQQKLIKKCLGRVFLTFHQDQIKTQH